jgi:hypothetical protein
MLKNIIIIVFALIIIGLLVHILKPRPYKPNYRSMYFGYECGSLAATSALNTTKDLSQRDKKSIQEAIENARIRDSLNLQELWKTKNKLQE